jgi:hypothetical protein
VGVPHGLRLLAALTSAALDRHLLQSEPPLPLTTISHHRRAGWPAIGVSEEATGAPREASALQGHVSIARELVLECGTLVDGDVKAARVTVAPGARRRGNVEFAGTGREARRVGTRSSVIARHLAAP